MEQSEMSWAVRERSNKLATLLACFKRSSREVNEKSSLGALEILEINTGDSSIYQEVAWVIWRKPIVTGYITSRTGGQNVNKNLLTFVSIL